MRVLNLRAVWMAVFTTLAGLSSATEITVSYSFPRVFAENEPVITALEGSVTATIVGDDRIRPAQAYPDLEQVNDWTYRTVFYWDDQTPRLLSFIDSADDTTTVTVQPQPVMPLTPELHPSLVFHITTAPASLWDPATGIYVWGLYDNCLQSGGAWEREAHVEVYDAQHELVVAEPIGLRLNGNSSRVYPQKSWRLYFDGYGSADEVDWDFFGEGPTLFQRLILKGSWIPRFILSASLAEPLHRELGHLGSRLVPAAAYVNGEYWGIYTLRERLDSKFVEVTQHLADDDYVLIKDSAAEHGNLQEWEDFLDLFEPPQAFASHAWYEEVRRRLDLTSYVDWLLINAYGATADNGYVNNYAALKVAGGAWHFVMWDEEDLFLPGNLNADHFRFYASADEAEFNQFRPYYWFMGGWTPEAQRWFNIFRGLLQNSEFKAFFAARTDELLAGPLSVDALQSRLAAITAPLDAEATRQRQRWGWSPTAYSSTVSDISGFIAARHPIVQQQKIDLLDHFAVPVELSHFAAVRTPQGVRLTWRTEREIGNDGFVVTRGVGSPDVMTPIASYVETPALRGRPAEDAPTAYVWTDEDTPVGEALYYQLRHVEAGGETVVHDWVETVGVAGPVALVINEILANNASVNQDEAGEFDDWIELRNTGDADLSVGGMTLSDDLEDPAKWTLPDVTIPAGGHLLVWCDGDAEQGPLHATFSLAATGEAIGIFTAPADGSQLVDSMVFGPQAVDVSLGRQPDGADTWVFFSPPTPGLTNDVGVGVPPAADGTLSLSAWPNPFNPRVTVAYTVPAAGSGELAVFAADGRRVATLLAGHLPAGPGRVVWQGRDDAGRAVPTGTYLCRLAVGGSVVSRKLLLLR
jgi:hypothetical protein